MARRRKHWWTGIQLSSVQSMIVIATGTITILGAAYSFTQFVRPPVVSGALVATVQDAESQLAVGDAAIEILTLQDALVVTLSPDSTGRAQQTLPAGPYRVRVSHPYYSAESRKIQVIPKQTVALQLKLRPGSSAPLDRAKSAVTGGVRAVGRKLGF
jgi:hypothetical protein